MNSEIPQKTVTLESVATTVDALSASVRSLVSAVAELPTRNDISKLATKEDLKETNQKIDALKVHMDKRTDDTEARLDTYINDLRKDMNKEFKKVHIKLGEMDENLTSFNHEFTYKIAGMQGQIEKIYTHYPNRNEFNYVDGRVKKLEEKVFA